MKQPFGLTSGMEGRVVIVTGAASGLGLSYARGLVETGARVALADILEPEHEVLEGFASKASALFIRTDVRSPGETIKLAETVLDTYGRIDVLITNAALFSQIRRCPLEELDPKDWEEVLSVNVVGTFNCIRAVVPAMKAQKSGKIITIASNAVHKGLPFMLHYVASKGAIVAMTRALARELGTSGITVNSVAPGYVLHEATARSDRGRNEEVVRLRALCRTETPDDLLGTILFLASPQSDFITGQTIVVDGGEVFA